jgi:hypothetical protein
MFCEFVDDFVMGDHYNDSVAKSAETLKTLSHNLNTRTEISWRYVHSNSTSLLFAEYKILLKVEVKAAGKVWLFFEGMIF